MAESVTTRFGLAPDSFVVVLDTDECNPALIAIVKTLHDHKPTIRSELAAWVQQLFGCRGTLRCRKCHYRTTDTECFEHHQCLAVVEALRKWW